jgi:hypothetical protein
MPAAISVDRTPLRLPSAYSAMAWSRPTASNRSATLAERFTDSIRAFMIRPSRYRAAIDVRLSSSALVVIGTDILRTVATINAMGVAPVGA